MKRSVCAWLSICLGFVGIVMPCSTVLAADVYKIDPQHTFSYFEYSHWGLSQQRGKFERNSGVIEIDFEGKSGKILIEIDASSVSTGTSLFDETLRSSRFFDSDTFPKISFQSEQLLFNEQNKLIGLDGLLTIKNIARRIRIDVTYFNCRFMPLYFANACGANGSAKILRSDFDLGKYTPFVSDEVTLSFNLEAIKQ